MRNHSNLSKSITKYDDYSPKDKVQKQQNIKLQYWHRITPMVQKNPKYRNTCDISMHLLKKQQISKRRYQSLTRVIFQS